MADDGSHTLVGGELDGFELRTEHPQASLEERLQLVDFVDACDPNFGAQLSDEFQAVLDFVEHELGHADRPFGQDGVQRVVIVGLAFVQEIEQTIARLGFLQLGQDRGELNNFLFTKVRASLHHFVDEGLNAIFATWGQRVDGVANTLDHGGALGFTLAFTAAVNDLPDAVLDGLARGAPSWVVVLEPTPVWRDCVMLVQEICLDDEGEALGLGRATIKYTLVIAAAPFAVADGTGLHPPGDAMLLCCPVGLFGVDVQDGYFP
ncbi:hypothetical protein D9M70_464130 [compost metagenome]